MGVSAKSPPHVHSHHPLAICGTDFHPGCSPGPGAELAWDAAETPTAWSFLVELKSQHCQAQAQRHMVRVTLGEQVGVSPAL